MPESSQESLRDKIIRDLSAREDIDEIIANARVKLSQPPPKEPTGRGISRRNFLLGLAGAAIAGFVAGRSTASQTENFPEPSLPEPSKEQINNLNGLIRPLIDLRGRRRALWAKDPEHSGIEMELNANLINIGLSAYAEGHGEALTAISYNLLTGQSTSVAYTRETIVPEIIDVNRKKRPNYQAVYKSDFATPMFIHETGGFELMRKVIEDSSGLSADIGMFMDDIALHDLIKNVLGDKIEIEIKEDMYLVDFSFEKRWRYGPQGRRLKQGKHEMSAGEAMRFILSENGDYDGPNPYQLPGRKNDIIRAVMHKAMGMLQEDPGGTLGRIAIFFQDQVKKGQVKIDIDIGEMSKILSEMAIKAGAAKLRGIKFTIPEMGSDGVLVNDEYFGGEGIMRVHRFINEHDQPSEEYYKYAHPNMQRLIDQTIKVMKELKSAGINLDDPEKGLAARGVLPLWAQVPALGDLNSPNPATGYWKSTREFIQRKLGV